MTDLKMRLDLFEGDGGAGAAAPAGAGVTAGNAPSGKAGANVIYGKQDAADPDETETPAAGEKDTAQSADDKRKAFLDLVKGEYKDIYTQETQKIIDRRFKETKTLEEAHAKSKPVLDMLMQRYGIEDGDLSRLQEAVESDDAYWSDAADEAGMTVEQYKKFQKMQRQNAELLKAQQEQEGKQAAEQQVQKWLAEADAMKEQYPEFDLQAESQNPDFARLISAGIPVKTAYEVTHLDTIVGSVAQAAAAKTERDVTNNIRARGMRPKENGTTSQAAFTVKDDVSKLTRKDREEIARRVAMGDVIRF